MSSNDVEMFTLRRSERIAKLQEKKKQLAEKQEVVQPKPRCTIKPQTAVKKKQNRKKVKPSIIELITNTDDLEKIKINHLLPLVEKHCSDNTERTFKCKIINIILKNYKKIGIRNNVKDLSLHVNKVSYCLHMMNVGLSSVVDIQDALTSIMLFPELPVNTPIATNSVDELVGLLQQMNTNTTSIDSSLTSLFEKFSL
jgi:hypothetical protein